MHFTDKVRTFFLLFWQGKTFWLVLVKLMDCVRVQDLLRGSGWS